MKYTDRVIVLGKIADALDRNDLVSQLKELRKYSDIAELVLHSKNPNKGIGVFDSETKKVNTFREGLDTIREAIYDCFVQAGKEDFYQKNVRNLLSSDKPDMDKIVKTVTEIRSWNLPSNQTPAV